MLIRKCVNDSILKMIRILNFISLNLIPQCVTCGSVVSNLLEPEVEKTGQLKRGIMLIAEGYVMIACNQMKPRMGIKKKQ